MHRLPLVERSRNPYASKMPPRHPLAQAALDFLKTRALRAGEGAVHAIAEDGAEIADALGDALKQKAREIRDRHVVVSRKER